MLSLQNITLAQGANILVQDLSLDVFEKYKIGLVGANGCGKSSLLSLILGKLEPNRGEIRFKKDLRLASIAQETPALETSALDFTISGDAHLAEVLERLGEAEAKDDYEAIMACHSQLHEMDGYSAEARAAKILIGLGFSQDEILLPVKNFSGGWRMRLNLAKCLFCPSELLLLDEPTNHLDMEAIIWLEAFIQRYPGAVVMVSHDQDFLNNTTTHIAHIEWGKLKCYTGDYDNFVKMRAEQLAQQQAAHKKQQAEIAHMQKFVDRFRAKATKAKQAQSRLKAIEKMVLVEAVRESSPFHFQFLAPAAVADPMLAIKRVDLGYDEQPVLRNINLQLRMGERIGLLGVNGAGKSTLIKGLCGEIAPLAGEIVRPNKLVVGYFAQHQVDYLPIEDSPLQILGEAFPNKSERELTTYLGSFAFDREQSLTPLKTFSGGEKARVALALLIARRPNLLLLDEPTNHLDLDMRQALSYALQGFEGALILVSHDRHLMQTLVDDLLLVDDGKVAPYRDSIESYHRG